MVFFAQKNYGETWVWISLRGHKGSHRFSVVGPLDGAHLKTWGLWDAAETLGNQWSYHDSRSEAFDEVSARTAG